MIPATPSWSATRTAAESTRSRVSREVLRALKRVHPLDSRTLYGYGPPWLTRTLYGGAAQFREAGHRQRDPALQAIVFSHYGRPGSVRLTEVDTPSPSPEEVLVRVRSSSLNAGDWHALRGRPYLMRGATGLRRPKRGRLGVDVAGVVEEVGSEVRDLRVGSRVYGMVPDGAFAEFVVGGIWFVPMPSSLTFEQAAAVPSAGCTALQAVRDQGNVRAGERVLVYGAGGGVGTFTVQIATSLGAHVTAATSTDKVDGVRSVGADEVIDYRATGIGHLDGLFDVVIDLGGDRTIGTLRRLLAPGGRLVLVAAGRGLGGPIGRFAAGAARAAILRQEVAAFVASPPFRENLETLSGLIDQGTVRPIIDRTYDLSRTAEAIARMGSGAALGKIVLTVP